VNLERLPSDYDRAASPYSALLDSEM